MYSFDMPSLYGRLVACLVGEIILVERFGGIYLKSSDDKTNPLDLSSCTGRVIFRHMRIVSAF